MVMFAVILFVICVLSVFIGRQVSSVPKPHRKRMEQARHARSLFSSGRLSPSQAYAYVRKISPYAFEELVLDGFMEHGYKVTRNQRYSGDGGYDGKVSKNGIDFLIQCKRYRSYICRSDVEDFSRLCTRNCCKGFFVHTGKTGAGAWETAGVYGNVDIVSGDRMLAVIGYDSLKRRPADHES